MSRSPPLVLLFDVDGTLLHASGAGRRAISQALGDVLGTPHVLNAVDFRGMTDLALFRAALGVATGELDASLLERLTDSYLAHLAREVRDERSYTVCRGTLAALERLTRRAATAVGLGTGNFERGARIKLERGGLNRFFEFGGFGEDAEDRSLLLRAGALRGAERLGQALESCRVVVIGDTPRDVAAALAIGAECVGVATGGHSTLELSRAGAAAAFPDLAEDGAIEAICGDTVELLDRRSGRA